MPVAPLDARTRRSVIALLASILCASAAGMAGFVALGKQVFDISGRELDLGWLGLAEFAPAAVLVLVTGTVADRFDRRHVAAVAIAAQAMIACGLGLYALQQPHSATPIFAIVLLLGIARAFVAPAERSLPADIVSPERLPWLTARFSGSWQAAAIVGPVLGGFLYAIDPWWSYFAMALLLIVAAGAILLVHPQLAQHDAPPIQDQPIQDQPIRDKPSLREALLGLKFIRGHPVMLGAISLDLFAVLFGGAVALLPALAEKRFGVGSVGLGWLRAAGGIGAALVTATLAIRPLRTRIGRMLLCVVAVFGLATIALGVTRNYAVAFIAMMILSGADAVSVFIRATLVPLVTPVELRGRVLAVENVFIGASNELGAFESGVVGQWLGPATAVVLGGFATLAIAAAWWLVFPALRDVDRFPGT